MNNSRNIGQQIQILQLNIEGISRAKCDVIEKLCREKQVDIIVLQETHAESSEDLSRRGKIPGFSIIISENSRVHGIATYVRNDILNNIVILESLTENNTYASTIRVKDIHITNIYKSPAVNWSESILKIFPHPAIYLGDFNSHHEEWCYNNNDENGEFLVDWASKNELHLVFDAKDNYTFYSQAHQRGYNPDLCFVSSDSEGLPLQVQRVVLSNFPNTQHRPILYNIGISIPIIQSIQRPRWNFQKANWNQYEKNLDDVIRFIKPTCENYENFVKLVISTAKKSIPRGYRKEYIPCWNEESDRLYEELKENSDPEVAKSLLKSLDEARRTKWINTVQSLDFTKSSRKSWSLMRKLGGATKSNNVRPNINPNAIAQRIVNSSKVPADKPFTREIYKKYRRLRKRTRRDSQLSRPFEIEEVDLAISQIKKGKAAGFDAIYPEFLIHSGKRVRNWLTNFFTDLMRRNKLPSFFKKSKIIAILKPGKPNDQPESYRPIALLSVTLKLLERIIINRIYPSIESTIPIEQAGFMKGRSCADQVLSLTNFIEKGFQNKHKTGVVFIDLTAAYDTIWKKGLIYKLLKVIPCRRICDFLMNILSDRHFQVFLNDVKSRVRKLNNGLPQGSVLSCFLFNLYISDLPRSKSRKFLYADDMAYAFQAKKFSRISKVLTDDLIPFTNYCKKWRLLPSLSKTVTSCFHLNHRDAFHTLDVQMNGINLHHEFEPKYLGVTLDRTLTYKKHLVNLNAKLRTRNNLVQKLSSTSWGANANCLRTSSLALVYSCAEYCCSTWLNSAHTNKVDTQLNKTMRIISGTVSSTPTDWLPALCNILPPKIRRQQALSREYQKIIQNPNLPINDDLPPQILRLKSRNPSLATAQQLIESNFNGQLSWENEWNHNNLTSPLFDLHSNRKSEMELNRKTWCNLNRLRTQHGRCNYMLHKWRIKDDPLCEYCKVNETTNHILFDCPTNKYNGNINDIRELSESAKTWLYNLNL